MQSLKQLVTILRNWLYPQVPVRDVPRLNRQAKRLEVESSRRTRVKDCRTMYDEDPRIEGLVDKFASDAVRGGFTLTVKNSPQEQKIANALVKRLKLFSRRNKLDRQAT